MLVFEEFIQISQSERLVENVGDAFIATTIGNELTDIADKEPATCHLNVVVDPSKKFVEKLNFHKKGRIHVFKGIFEICFK